MRPASYQPSSEQERGSFRRRATALLLTLAVHILILLALVTLAPMQTRLFRREAKPITFQLLPEGRPTQTPTPTADKAKRASGGGARRSPVHAQAPPPPTAPPPVPVDAPLHMMILSKEDFASANIGALPSHPEARAAGSGESAGAGAGRESGSASAAGEGPRGQRLYNADWYKRPTNAELSTYLPASAPRTGFGEVACRTVERYHVEDCAELDESPPGSGFARAVRQAAWQFLVLPPRLGGKPLVGEWVRIRITYSEGAASAR